MATTYKVLAQSAPAATTNTDIYTVGTGKSAVISTVVIANRANSVGSFRLAVRVGGAALSNAHYVAYDVAVGANDSTTLTIGMTLAATDIVTVYTSTSNFSINIFGTEIV